MSSLEILKKHMHCVKSVQIRSFFLVHIFPHSDWIRRETEYLSSFSPNAGKYGPEKSPVFWHFSRSGVVFVIILLLPIIILFEEILHDIFEWKHENIKILLSKEFEPFWWKTFWYNFSRISIINLDILDHFKTKLMKCNFVGYYMFFS